MRDRYADTVSWIDRCLAVPGVDDDPTPRFRALCIRQLALWPLGRGAERPRALAELEADARALGNPVFVSLALVGQVYVEVVAGRIDAADALADAALEWAAASDDEWTIAEVAKAKAYAASTLAELRERVDRAASLLAEVGNVYEVANLFSSAAYQALCLAGENDAKQLVDRVLPITRELDSPYLSMILHGNLGLAALLTGDPDAARQAFRDQLELCRELVVPPVSSEGLLGLAAVATVHDDLDCAARLAGAADAHRCGQPTGPVEARLHATFLERARARHGASTWDRAMSEGAALSFNDAIATALAEPAAKTGDSVEPPAPAAPPGY